MSILLLEQPRRGKTREAQVTPHKAEAAVWCREEDTSSSSSPEGAKF